MNTRTNQPSTVPSAPTRIILASANRHELHSAGRQDERSKLCGKCGALTITSCLKSPMCTASRPQMSHQ